MRSTFFQFSQLPSELRVQIWRFHLATQREIYITTDGKDRDHFLIENQTPLLSVNQESRNESLSYYRSVLGVSYSNNVLVDETTRCECITYLRQMCEEKNTNDVFHPGLDRFLSRVPRKKPGVWFNPHWDILRMTTDTFAYLPDLIKEQCELLRLDIRGETHSEIPMLGRRSYNFTNQDGIIETFHYDYSYTDANPGRDSWWMPGLRECFGLRNLELIHDVPYVDEDSERWDKASEGLADSYDRVFKMMGCRIAALWVGGQCKGTIRTWGVSWLQERAISRPSLDKMLLEWRPHS